MNRKILIISLIIGIVLVGGLLIIYFFHCSGEHPEFCDRSCNIDEDCKSACPCGAINKNEVCSIIDPRTKYDCAFFEVECKNGKCVEKEYNSE